MPCGHLTPHHPLIWSTHLSQYITQRRPTTPQTATPTRAAITGIWSAAVIRRRGERDTRWKYKMENWSSSVFLPWCPTCLFSWLKIVTVTGLSSLWLKDRKRRGKYMKSECCQNVVTSLSICQFFGICYVAVLDCLVDIQQTCRTSGFVITYISYESPVV